MTEGAALGRVLGIDWGSKRIGLAISDRTRTLASPLGVVARRSGKRPPLKKLQEIADAEEVTGVVMGLPLEVDGSESEWTGEVRAVGRRLADRLGVPLAFADERFSSTEAVFRIRSTGLPRKKREGKGRVDQAAAALILQGWLDGAREWGRDEESA